MSKRQHSSTRASDRDGEPSTTRTGTDQRTALLAAEGVRGQSCAGTSPPTRPVPC